MAEQKRQLQYRKLGNTGLLVSELCLGTMTMQKTTVGPWGMGASDEDTSHKMLNEFYALGGNFLDTANVYKDSEEVLGRWIEKQSREKLVIATKARGQMGPGPNDCGTSRKQLLWSVENSLKLLKTDYIDLFQLHAWDLLTPISETFRTLDDLVRSGKVRYIGVSNFTGWQLQKAQDLCKQMGWESIVSLQPQYNLLCREIEWDLIPVCQNEGIGIIPWSPLQGGILAGNYGQTDSRATKWVSGGFMQYTDHSTKVIATVEQIAKATNHTMAQVALRWVMQRDGVTAPIIGGRKMEQVQDNLEAAFFKLSDEHMKQLNDASYIKPPYPWSHWSNSSRTSPLATPPPKKN